ncbi:hypothetical protein V6Z11_A12G063000 [Gossypium hirsutum]
MHKKGRELGLYRLPNPHQNPKGFRGIQMPRPLTTVEEESPLLTKECIKHAPIYCGPHVREYKVVAHISCGMEKH